MPTYGTRCGVYPANGTAGTEVSSTYEGRHLSFLESELVHPSHTDSLVDKGDPVVLGEIVGVAFKSAVAATDYIAIDTEGVWNLSVVAVNDNGNIAVAAGQELYINKSTAVISRIQNPATNTPFGYALGAVSSGQTAVIAVKIHFDISESTFEETPVMRSWNPNTETLQALIDSITDMSSSKPYLITVPPGRYTTTQLGTAPLSVKPWVNLKGAGGRGRVTIFASCALTMLDASIPAGVNRWRMEGIRFETSPVSLLCTAGTHTLVATIEDCPMNSASPMVVTGNTYGTATLMVNLEIRNMNIDCNVGTTQLFRLARVSFWNCDLLGMYFRDSDAYFGGCNLSSACNFVNDAASTGGWFEFFGCKIDTMALNDPTSESVLATAFASDNENVQIHNVFHGATAPGSINYWGRIQPGALYFCNADSKLYVKTGAVGTNTWTVVGAQA